MTHHQSKVIQSNNYYPFGLQHTSSWTRSTERKNNRLYNAGSELNEQTKNYETFYRDYDPAIGRFNQIDPLAGSFSNLTPYNYAFNDPVALNDPNGDCPSCDFWEAVFAKLEDLGSSGSSTWTPGGGGAEGGAGGGGYGNSSYYGYNNHIGPGSGNHWSGGLETGPNGEAGRWRNFNYNEDDEIFITSTWVPAQDQNGGGSDGLGLASTLSSPLTGAGLMYLQNTTDDILRGTSELSKSFSKVKMSSSGLRLLNGASYVAGAIVINQTLNNNKLSTGRKVAEIGVTTAPWAVTALAAAGVISTATPVGWVSVGVGLIGSTGLMVYDGVTWALQETAKASVQFQNAVGRGWYPGR